MSCGTCTGSCCVAFPFADLDRVAAGGKDYDYLKDMLVPLNLVEAAERMEKFGVMPSWADQNVHDWDGRYTEDPNRRLYKCRHWNEETRLCGAYDTRPQMCADYPYYGDCEHGCGFKLTYQQMWDRELRIAGPEAGTPRNIERGYN